MSKHPTYDKLEPRYFLELKEIMEFSKSKNRPYFLENGEWSCISKLKEYYIFNLTKLGKENPKVMKSYMDFYNIQHKDVFDYKSNYNIKTEFELKSKDSITIKMKKYGATDKEIKEAIDLWININEIMAKENKNNFNLNSNE